MKKVKIFADMENGDELEEKLNDLISKTSDVIDIKFSSAIGNFEGEPFHTVSAMVIYK